MLNLFDPILFTSDEKVHVETVLKPQLSAGWDDQKVKTKALKNRISEHTIIAQGGRCAYCESPLLKGAAEIEHIAPKGMYGEFCFEPYNLVTSCTSCNSTANKGEQDTMVHPIYWGDYTANRFKIVHPYFDTPDEHIAYIGTERIVFDKQGCSRKGLETIDMFHWEEQWAINQRIATARSRDIPLNVLKMVGEIVTYK